MTVMAERASSQWSLDMFERIAESAAREDETVGLAAGRAMGPTPTAC
ncbi:hypothetical protein [Streptomyces cellostaticus]|nr:hypothetical protein [Streptomyces cellostaticus]